MSFRTITKAQQAVWPLVQQSLRLHRASRQAYRRGEPVSAKAAQNAERSWDRIVMEETVWATAKSDLLLTPATRAVIEAARAWAKVGPISDDYGDDPEDIALYKAVQELAVDPEGFPAEESLTPVEAPRNVSSINSN